MEESVHSIHQLEAALIQLEKSCEVYLAGEYIPALTLAGAAEEILGVLAESKYKTHLGRSKNERGLNALNLQTDVMVAWFGGDNVSYKQRRNSLKNQLKHVTSGEVVNIAEIRLKTLQMIGDALMNYKLIHSKLPDLRI